MPAWIVRTFGDEQLTLLFWVITALPLPLWALMIAVPNQRLTRRVAGPLRYPLVLLPGLLYLYILSFRLGMPLAFVDGRYAEFEKFFTHPIVFLTLWAQLQVLHLILGVVIFQDARSRNLTVPVALLITWFGGPLGLFWYAMRLLIHRLFGGRLKGGLAK
ncbi:MAG: abscisic acid-deficient protein Aba4 family protein [Opitutales bacterium]